jgi:transcriptional regulator with XRE-family HTH domain
MTTSGGDPRVTRLLVIFLRYFAGKKTQAEFGRAVGIDQSEISRLEEGLKAAPEEVLRRMAAADDLDWSVVVHLRRLFEAALSTAGRRVGTPQGAADSLERAPELAEVALEFAAMVPGGTGAGAVETASQVPDSSPAGMPVA